ncbi:MAG TPA: trigger factor family protein, partial [Candidatus Syntrophosphaera sp.]|nr:trigger factor family protein [Candidatus Syntrophosphaera sp.]
MQTEFKQIDPTTKEIVLTVETERVDAAYQKYLRKAAKSLEVPGFRKGKAPLSMVIRLHGDRIKDYFEKDFVDEAFGEAAREHEIRFLLYPEVKEIEWQQGSEMKITLEIEHEPP